MIPEKIKELLIKSSEGNLTEEEILEITNWLVKDDSSQKAEFVTEFLQIIPIDGKDVLPHWEKLVEEILEVDKIAPNESIHRPSKIISIHQRKWWMVAAFIIMMCSCFWVWMRENTPTSEIVLKHSIYKNDILSGGNKAILITGDGSVINLDSAHIGEITTQGNSSISKAPNGTLLYNSNGNNFPIALQNQLITPIGGEYHLRLSDGTEVWLNALSSIKFPSSFDGSTRHVEISGEVYFEVAKNTKSPFFVSINGSAEVQVIGTKFNINTYKDDGKIKTTLLEGGIKITKDSKSVLLVPGQQAIYSDSGNIEVVNKVDAETILSWKNGFFSFERTNLKIVLQQLSRWYNIDVEYKGELPDIYFGGEIPRNSSLVKVLKILEKSGVKFIVEGRKITVFN